MPAHFSAGVFSNHGSSVSPISTVRAYLDDFFAAHPPSRSNQKPILVVPPGQQIFAGPTTLAPVQKASTSKKRTRRPHAIPIIDPFTGKDVSSELYEPELPHGLDPASDGEQEREEIVYSAVLPAVPPAVPIPPSRIATRQRASKRSAQVQKLVLTLEKRRSLGPFRL